MKNLKKLREETKNITVLYAEDDKETRDQFIELFSMLFENIEISFDGKDALDKYKQKKYDLVITDINMPKMNGLELIESLRAINEFQKVIIVSAHNSSEYLLEAIALDVDGFLLKPIDISQLENILFKISRAIHADKLLSAYHEELERDVEIKTAKLAKQLVTDELTGLLNRKALDIKLRTRGAKTFFLLNIDNFDSMNVTYGYSNGDLILKSVTSFLKEQLPDSSSLYYLGADEFAMVFGEVTSIEINDIANKIQNEVSKHTLVINDFNIKFTITIAITSGEENLHRNAHIALKDAHNKGKNRIAVYDENSPTEILQSKIQEYMPIIRKAIAKRYITPYFQPIVNNKTKKIEKFESLARIVDDEQNIHQPFHFINIAELTGMIPEITRIMIDKTFDAFKDNNFHFSINISEYDLNDEYLLDYLKEKTNEYNLKPSRVIIEVLEGVSANGVEHGIKQLNALKEYGFSIAIDDFGTENSNFERVHNMNIDFIKIDGSFIKNIDTNEKSYNIAKTITEFAKSIGAKVIAEYVHSKEVLDKVNELGIEYTQGYYFAEPCSKIIYKLEEK